MELLDYAFTPASKAPVCSNPAHVRLLLMVINVGPRHGNKYLVDSLPVHVHDLEPEALVDKGVGFGRSAVEVVDHKAADGVEGLHFPVLVHVDAEPFEEVVERCVCVDEI